MTRNESTAEATAEDMELELDFFLRLVNSRRSRRGDWDSIILELSHLHLTVPDAIERAAWMPSTSTLVVTVNLEPSSAPLPLLEDLSIFIPHDAPPFCYASAEATAGAASIADAITSKLQPQGCFLALTVVHAIELALKTVGVTTEERLDVRRMAEDRILAKVAAHRDACDVLMCLLVAAVSSPKGLRPWPAHFSLAQQDIDRTRLSRAIARVPTLSSLPKEVPNLPAESVHLLDWLWCRVPMTLEQVQNIQVQVPSLSGLRDICFGAQVIQSANPWFDSMVAKHSSKLCFHGSRFGSFHSIIQNGLQSMSGTRHMSSGNVFGDGIYFADCVSVSSQFASPASSTAAWSRSQVLSKAAICIAVCEVILNPQVTTHLPSQGDGSYYVVQDERFVRLRYLVLCQPPGSLRQNSPRSISWPAVFSFILVLLVAVTVRYVTEK
ncbi:Protein mono-ADP-ribosyltransferase parp16 [Aphanomyces cochlioides]|nr:Protein mono-ADP-ribosyltransferase parp16 [Aphanomyces cochlioides]